MLPESHISLKKQKKKERVNDTEIEGKKRWRHILVHDFVCLVCAHVHVFVCVTVCNFNIVLKIELPERMCC